MNTIQTQDIPENKNEVVASYNIEQIASWQRDVKNEIPSIQEFEISLPSLQRGFVWKPHQIESLWDSLLRGYPVGAVLMSQNGKKKELLDGQQRSTTIALGYVNPLKEDDSLEIFNLKKNIPAIWVDFKTINQSKYGIKHGVRVLTRSHPWGYQMNDHRKPLTTSDKEKALAYFRKRVGNDLMGFSKLPKKVHSPWDAHYPIPLAVLLETDDSTFGQWESTIRHYMQTELADIETKHSLGNPVDYTELESEDFETLYDAVKKAKKILIPEILVQKEILSEEDTNEETGDATLFVRLNSEGTRISGEELIYSLLKATFPEAKELVEKIGVRYMAPSRLVNLFARLSLMDVQGYNSFQKEMDMKSFRRELKSDAFLTKLKWFIFNEEEYHGSSPAQKLINDAIDILSFNNAIPKIYIKEIVNKVPDLFLVLLVYISKNQEGLENEKGQIYRDFHSIVIFNSDQKKAARLLFNGLKEESFRNWKEVVDHIRVKHYDMIFPMVEPKEFSHFALDCLLERYVSSRRTYFSNWDMLKDLFNSNKEQLKSFFLYMNDSDDLSDEMELNKGVEVAALYWQNLFSPVFWNKNLLALVQRDYFQQEFEEFMEFDGIEDTNRPWDWDHIYPHSWVGSKPYIAQIVRWIVNSNGNFRALSFNENRSQNNHESPSMRFENNLKAQKDSYIKENDLIYWSKLTNSHKRLTETKEKPNEMADVFVQACFTRMVNIYTEIFELFGPETKN